MPTRRPAHNNSSKYISNLMNCVFIQFLMSGLRHVRHLQSAAYYCPRYFNLKKTFFTDTLGNVVDMVYHRAFCAYSHCWCVVYNCLLARFVVCKSQLCIWQVCVCVCVCMHTLAGDTAWLGRRITGCDCVEEMAIVSLIDWLIDRMAWWLTVPVSLSLCVCVSLSVCLSVCVLVCVFDCLTDSPVKALVTNCHAIL